MVVIRQSTLKDIDDIVEMRMKLLHELGKIETEEGTITMRELTRSYFIKKTQTGEFTAWLAEDEGIIIAMTCLHFIENPPVYENIPGLEAIVFDVYSKDEYRGKGIATTLMSRVIEYAREMKARRLVLNTIGTDKRIYEKQGFKSLTSEMELVLR